MDKVADRRNGAPNLYPAVMPFDQRVLEVGDGHHVYVEQCGNPNGIPVVVLHGGPGGGCSPAMRRYFDPKIYRVVLFDQRGCGRSRPHASIQHNTTWDLVRDIELIRETLNIRAWIVFGGSWGATLSLIYAETHPERVAYLVLRGVFLATQEELDWFYGGGAGKFWPDMWDRFAGMIPESEQADLIEAYHSRLFSDDTMLQTRFARAWASWENTLASINNEGPGGESPAEYARAFARIENHYFRNKAFLRQDGQILADIQKIAHIPGVIVQGRYDMVCPPVSAYRLHKAWPKSELRMIGKAGHALSEDGISSELARTMERLKRDADIRSLMEFPT